MFFTFSGDPMLDLFLFNFSMEFRAEFSAKREHRPNENDLIDDVYHAQIKLHAPSD